MLMPPPAEARKQLNARRELGKLPFRGCVLGGPYASHEVPSLQNEEATMVMVTNERVQVLEQDSRGIVKHGLD